MNKGGKLAAACHDDVRADDAAYLVVRPVSLAPAAEGADGVVLSSAFHGMTAEYEIETSTGTLVARVPDPAGLLAHGTPMRVELDERRSYILRKP
jgi:iron(III) transport system ATP-binding protein